MNITVELFGIPRTGAGGCPHRGPRPAACRRVGRSGPTLSALGRRMFRGRPAAGTGYLANLNSQRFVADPSTMLHTRRLAADPFRRCRRLAGLQRMTPPRRQTIWLSRLLFAGRRRAGKRHACSARQRRIAELSRRQRAGRAPAAARGAAAVDPLSPEAPLAFVFSPLVGSPLTTSAKFAVVSRSPLSDRINDSLSSSHFAIAGKRTGGDAIVLVGRAVALSVLVIDDGQARLEPAEELRGLSCGETEARVRAHVGDGYRIRPDRPGGRAASAVCHDLA